MLTRRRSELTACLRVAGRRTRNARTYHPEGTVFAEPDWRAQRRDGRAHRPYAGAVSVLVRLCRRAGRLALLEWRTPTKISSDVRWIPRRCSSRTSAISPARARARHRDYVRLVEPLAIPGCVRHRQPKKPPRAPAAWGSRSKLDRLRLLPWVNPLRRHRQRAGSGRRARRELRGADGGERAQPRSRTSMSAEEARPASSTASCSLTLPPQLDRHDQPHPEWGFTKRPGGRVPPPSRQLRPPRARPKKRPKKHKDNQNASGGGGPT